MIKQVTRYEIREFNGNEYSKRLGGRLRTRAEANRVVKILKATGRAAFAAPLKIAI